MRRFQMSATALAVMLALGGALAEAQRPPRETRSENGRFLLRVSPGRAGRSGPSCQATLYECTPRGDADRRVWERPLVNDTAPLRVVVRDDGRLVVTLDEYRRGGARHAVVVYGAQGELLRHFLLTDLLTKDDWPNVKASRREVVWLKDARCGFDAGAEQFVIELAWGRKIRIDLKTLGVVRDAAGTTVEEAGTIPAEILAQLFDHAATAEERATAERAAEIAELSPGEQAQTTAIARQLSGASEAPTTLVAEATSAPAADVAETPAELASSVAPAPVPAGIAVPLPNAAERVDYVAWLNELGQIDGPDARPVYDAAVAKLWPWPGEAELLAAAARGDAAALAAPEMTAWLEANAEAIAAFREAAQYPAKGWNLHSEDGTALAVLLPDLAPLRTLARATLVEGRQLAAAGQGAAAAECYLDVLAAGAHTGGGLTLIENLVGMAMQTPAAEALLDLEAGPAGDTLDYAVLSRDAEAAYRPTRPAAEAVQGERAFFMDAVQRVWDVDPQTGDCVLNATKARELLALVEGEHGDAAQQAQDLNRLKDIGYEQTVATGAAYYDALTAALALPYPEAHPRVAEIENALASDENAHPLLRRLTPSLERYGFLMTRGETTRAASLLATHLHAYWQEHGEYPASLEVFAGQDFATDPFSAAPFVYRRAGNDFVLYSIGGNGVDDSGVHDRKGETNDLVFWPRP